MDWLGAAWRTYRTRVIPLTAPPVQATESRRAFYAGAHALFTVMLAALEPGDGEPTAAELRMVDELDEELRAFAQEIKDGRA